MLFPAVLDACVLVPYPLYDVLLRTAEHSLYRPHWSPHILDEVERNVVVQLGQDPARAKQRIDAMERAFPDASVSGYEKIVPAMTNHPKDRHVLAAAVISEAQVIVTANLKDFPAWALADYEIDAVHPDDFLLDLLDLSPGTVATCLDQMLRANRKPPKVLADLAVYLQPTVPKFAEAVRSL